MNRAAHIALAASLVVAAIAAAEARAEVPYAVVLPIPSKGGDVDVKAAPSRLMLGEDHEATVAVTVPRGAIRVRLMASAGKIVKSTFTTTSRLVARYQPPEGFLPQVDVIVALVDTRDGTKFGFTALQLIGQGEAVLKTRPFAAARITIGDHDYGPAQADKRGEARIRIQVPPGTNVGYDENLAAVDLGVPQMPRVALFCPAAEIAMDSPAPLPVYAVVTRRDGGADTGTRPSFSVDRGTLSEPRDLGAGAWTAMYTPPFEGSGAVVVTASIPGEDVPFAATEISLVQRGTDRDGVGVIAAPPAEENAHGRAPSVEPKATAVHVIDTALKLGFAWNLGAMTSFDLSADVGYELDLRSVGLRFGVELGFSRDSAVGSPDLETGTEVDVTSTVWMVPLSFGGGCRFRLADDWSMLVQAEVAATLVDNRIHVDAGGADLHEREWIPAFGGAAEIDRDLGPGAVLVELRYLNVFGDLATIDGRLATLYVNAGYRFSFEPF